MRTELYKITTGSLLHDVGKVVHRTGDSHSHAESGYAFLKEQTGLDENEMRL
ncbi:HD domain-containing protein [Agathobaculum butyriciproducens]|nr:HD domain-containing protein [Butyricicoccus sp. AF86-03b2A]RGC56109.1 HD domain-containing protein [Agathobaculum butyriciproducens]RGC60319.1 HD domain-containing protein [Agathobaculum butyriciproducens]